MNKLAVKEHLPQNAIFTVVGTALPLKMVFCHPKEEGQVTA